MNIEQVGIQVLLWQQCPYTPALSCSMDPDHPPMVWDPRGFIICTDENCGLIRYATDINPQVLHMTHTEGHRGCLGSEYEEQWVGRQTLSDWQHENRLNDNFAKMDRMGHQ